MLGPLTSNKIAAIYTTTAEFHGHYVLDYAKAKLFMEELGMWVLTAIDELESDDLEYVLVSVAKLFVESASGIMAIVAERDSSNERGTEISPVLPHQLVHLDMRTFVSYINGHCKRFERTFSDVEINRIADNLAHLQRAYREETVFKAAVNASSGHM